MAPTVTTVTVSDDDPQKYEDLHVHSVYDEIAPHFSSTRYKVSSSTPHVCSQVNAFLPSSLGRSLPNFSNLFQQVG